MTQRRFENSYPVSLAVAIAVLVPYIVTTTASLSYQDQLIRDLGTNRGTLAIITGLSEAAYAFGALIGGDFGQRFLQRHTWLVVTGILVMASLDASVAHTALIYGGGLIVMGLTTGMLVILSLPPVIRRFPPENMPISAAFVNIGFFGASAAGPLIGGLVADAEAWRAFYLILAAIGGLAFGLALATLPDSKPQNPDLPFDAGGIGLGFLAMSLLFFGTSGLSTHAVISWRVLPAIVLGAMCLGTLLTTEARKDEPLSPIKPMWTTFPVVGVMAAMFGGGAFVSLVSLAMQMLREIGLQTPLAIGFDFSPQILGALVGAVFLSFALPRGLMPALILIGFLSLLGGGTFLLSVNPADSRFTLLTIALLLGFGAGATVSPGLYTASFSLPSPLLGRCFALVELMRAAADYSLAPIVRHRAQAASHGQMISIAGIHAGIRMTLAVTVCAMMVGTAIYLVGKGFALPQSDIRGWLKGNRPAIQSPPLLAQFRSAEHISTRKRSRAP